MNSELELPADIDSQLWLTLAFDGRRGYILGNSHTVRGTFSVYLDENTSYSCRLEDVGEMGEKTRAWVAGFLAGQEPAPWEILGSEYNPFDEDELKTWRAACVDFRTTGRWPNEVANGAR